MAFYFVDQVQNCADSQISGSVNFGVSDRYRVEKNGKVKHIAPGVVSEAMGQLVSWLVLKDGKFTGRPVFMFAEKIRIHAMVQAGTRVELRGHISQLDQQSLCFSAEAKVDGKVVQEIENCNGYIMDLGELEDPILAQEQFSALISRGMPDHRSSSQSFDTKDFVSGIRIEGPKVISAECRIPREADFYKEHFPRKPVTPIVVLNELIGSIAELQLDCSLEPRMVEDIKIRSFVEPNEEFTVQCQTVATEGESVAVNAIILKGGKRILTGRYQFATNR
jgi:3-hydroxymyristoyl/3-hydroxydecanoyl-(acyl carrier protein) dehydratase